MSTTYHNKQAHSKLNIKKQSSSNTAKKYGSKRIHKIFRIQKFTKSLALAPVGTTD